MDLAAAAATTTGFKLPEYSSMTFLFMAITSLGVKMIKVWRDTDKGQRSKFLFTSSTQFLLTYIVYQTIWRFNKEAQSQWMSAFFYFLIGSAFTRNILNAYFNKSELVGKAIDFDSITEHTLLALSLINELSGYLIDGKNVPEWYMMLVYLIGSSIVSYAGFWGYYQWKKSNVYSNLDIQKASGAFKILSVFGLHAAFTYGIWWVQHGKWWNVDNRNANREAFQNFFNRNPYTVYILTLFLMINTFLSLAVIKPKTIVPSSKSRQARRASPQSDEDDQPLLPTP